MISEDAFDSNYIPMVMTGDGDMLAPRYGDAVAFASARNLSEKHIWAVTEGDDDGLYANPGPALVNVIGYVVTEKPWATGNEAATYAEPVSDDLDMDDEPDFGPSL